MQNLSQSLDGLEYLIFFYSAHLNKFFTVIQLDYLIEPRVFVNMV